MSHLSPYRRNAKVAGAMFLVAMVTSLTGGTLIQRVIDQPDIITALPIGQWTVMVGVSLEIINAVAVIGIVAALWAPLKHSHPGSTVAYFGVRLIEAGVCAAAALVPLIQLAVIQPDGPSGAESLLGLLAVVRGTLLGIGVPIFFGISATVLYLMLYRTALVPTYIAIWGLIGTAGMLTNVVVTHPVVQPVLVLPIIANEIYLGIYLLTRGLRTTSSVSPETRTPAPIGG